jgi:hypothetical protein
LISSTQSSRVHLRHLAHINVLNDKDLQLESERQEESLRTIKLQNEILEQELLSKRLAN